MTPGSDLTSVAARASSPKLPRKSRWVAGPWAARPEADAGGGEGGEIDMRGQIDRAGGVERAGELVVAHGLQRFAGLGAACVAIVDDEQRAALRMQAGSEAFHHADAGGGNFEDAADGRVAVCGRDDRVGHGLAGDGEEERILTGDEAFVPARSGADQLAGSAARRRIHWR